MAKHIRLTKKRREWAEKRKNPTLLGSPLRHDIKVENRYAECIERLFDRMAKEVKRDVLKTFRTPESRKYFAEDASVASLITKTINRLSDKYVKIFNQVSKSFAMSMLKQVNKASQSSMFQSLKELSGGLGIKTSFISDDMNEILKASAQENIALIRTIPESYFQQLQGDLMRTITNPVKGGWSGMIEHIHEKLDLQYKNHHNKARNVALDQTRKAFNNLNAERMRAVGVEKYKWIHSGGGQKPRQRHINMNGNIYSLDDPPVIDYMYGEEVRGIPGQAINCRCTMLPIIEFKNV